MKEERGAVIRGIAAWIRGYMAMPAGYDLVLALWALHTWVFDKWDATPYLVITAPTKQAGKTLLGELVSMLCRNPENVASVTPAALFRSLKAQNGVMSIFCDEAENQASAAAGLMRQVMNTGYREGQYVTRTMPGGEVERFPVFCPKAFMLIGDVNDTLRDRSVVIRLERGKPERRYSRREATQEAGVLVSQLREHFTEHTSAVEWPTVVPEFLTGRDAEIWTALFSVAAVCGLTRAENDLLTRTAADLVALKTAPIRRFSDLGASEADAVDVTYSERLIADCRAVLQAGERNIFTTVLVERLRALPSAPWRTFKGAGLDDRELARLLSAHGIGPKMVRIGGRKQNTAARGYTAAMFKG